MAEPVLPSSGVDALVARLRDQGVEAGKREAQRLIAEATAEAKRIVASAREETNAMRKGAAEALERERAAAVAALDIACRDALLCVREGLERRIALRLREITAQALADAQSLTSLVVQATRAVVAQHDLPRMAELSAAPEIPADTLDSLVAALTREVLTDGVEVSVHASREHAVRLAFRGAGLELDISETSLTELLTAHLLPRFRALLEHHAEGA